MNSSEITLWGFLVKGFSLNRFNVDRVHVSYRNKKVRLLFLLQSKSSRRFAIDQIVDVGIDP